MGRKVKSKFRTIIQLLAMLFFNGYLLGFKKGKIFTGKSKEICLPVLNCYSCPGAVGSCPIGALQAVIGGHKYNFSFYVLGTIMLFGVIFGRLICGFLCPFGFFQDLLYKIPVFKLKVGKNVDEWMRKIKYLVLIVMVILLPMFFTNQFGIGAPYFCKYLCPVGIIEGAFPLLVVNVGLRSAIGVLFSWKVICLLIILIASLYVYRPFCKYLCPLGALYGLFNSFSIYQLQIDVENCSSCKICERSCDMNVEILQNINSSECIRCGKCKAICPNKAITKKIGLK